MPAWIALAAVLFCVPVQPKPAKVIAKPSAEATFKQRWLALHFKELVNR